MKYQFRYRVTYMPGGRTVTHYKYGSAHDHGSQGFTSMFPVYGHRGARMPYPSDDDFYQHGYSQGYSNNGSYNPFYGGSTEWVQVSPNGARGRVIWVQGSSDSSTCVPPPPPCDYEPTPPRVYPPRDDDGDTLKPVADKAKPDNKPISPEELSRGRAKPVSGSDNSTDETDPGFPYSGHTRSSHHSAYERGFHEVYDMTPGFLKTFGIKVHTKSRLTASEAEEIQRVITDSAREFDARLGSLSGKPWPRKDLRIHLFDDRADFENAAARSGDSVRGVGGFTNMESGKVFMPRGAVRSGFSEMTHVLAHELCHFYLHYSARSHLETEDRDPTNEGRDFIHEGLGNYLSYLTSQRSAKDADTYFHNAARQASHALRSNYRLQHAETLDELVIASKATGHHNLKYNLGLAVMKYWEEKHPGVLREVITQLSRLKHNHLNKKERGEILEKINKVPSGFSAWLEKQASRHHGEHEDHPDSGWSHGNPATPASGAEVAAVASRGIKVPSQKHEKTSVSTNKHEPTQVSEPTTAHPHSDKSQSGNSAANGNTDSSVREKTPTDDGCIEQKTAANGNSSAHPSSKHDAKPENKGTVEKGSDKTSHEHVPEHDQTKGVDNHVATAKPAAGPSTAGVHGTEVVGGQTNTSSNPVSSSFAAIESKFDHSYDVTSLVISRMNIECRVRSTGPLDDRTVVRAERIIKKTVRAFIEEFGVLPKSDTPRQVDVWIHSSKPALVESLAALGEDQNAGGMAWTSLGKIYVAKLGKTRFENLAHEVAHQMMHFATNGAFNNVKASQFLNEGVAEYIQQIAMLGRGMTLELSSIIDNVNKAMEKCPDLKNAKSFEEIASIIDKHPGDPVYEHLQYSLGASFVKYLQDTNPELLTGLFKGAATSGASKYGDTLPKELDAVYNASFLGWLAENGVSKFAQNHGMLTSNPADSIGYIDHIIDGKITRVSVYTANLEDSNHHTVGMLSPVAHKWVSGNITTLNPETHDGICIPQEYQHLKPIQTSSGLKYVYSNYNGVEYFSSKSNASVEQLSKAMAKYDNELAGIHTHVEELRSEFDSYVRSGCYGSGLQLLHSIKDVCSLLKGAMKGTNSSVEQELEQIEKGSADATPRQLRESVDVVHNAYKSYATAKAQALLDQPSSGSSDQAMLSRILKSLIYIDPETMIGVGSAVNFRQLAEDNPGKVFAICGTGQGGVSGVSIYLDGTKIGELPSNAELFLKHKDHKSGDDVERFAVSDVLKTVHTVYGVRPIVAVSKDENGNTVGKFVSGTKGDSSENGELEIVVNPFIEVPSGNMHVWKTLPTTKGIKVVSGVDANHDDVNKPGQPSIQKGDLVDDRGTYRTSDDMHEATIKSGTETLVEKMSSLQFYISEELRDDNNNVTERSTFNVRDAATGVVMQFPKSITHLKLVETSGGVRGLLPSTKDGNTNPRGMPEHFAKYAYIDPIHAYDRIDSKWSPTHSQYKMIDFSKYPAGTLFELRYDPNNMSVSRDENGNIIRHANYNYVSRVGIYAPDGTKIGELASAVTHFQGGLLLSYDPNYSHTDFVSGDPGLPANVKDVSSGVKSASLGDGGNTGTDRGYSDYYQFNHRAKKVDSSVLQEMRELAVTKASVSSDRSSHGARDDMPGANLTAGSTTERPATAQELGMLQKTLVFMTAPDDSAAHGKNAKYSFNIYDGEKEVYMSFPVAITHVKIVTHEGQKYLAPCTADGSVVTAGMPNVPVEQTYIKPIFVHTGMRVTDDAGALQTRVSLADLSKYVDGTLLEMRVGGNLSSGRGDKDGDVVRAAHLYDMQGVEVGVIPMNGITTAGKLVLEGAVHGQVPAYAHEAASSASDLIADESIVTRAMNFDQDSSSTFYSIQQEELRLAEASRASQNNVFNAPEEYPYTAQQEHSAAYVSGLSGLSSDDSTGSYQGHSGYDAMSL
ncbi:hypothetical protein [Candidatus Anaplasma sp. TIGMIC]|uniref:hypothetical protein n=1 Tax=Candidatus Anaplasma sp. TIGMIC TaxID=3020713 RepID=UPI00232CF69B|nr:hypothetical protein [Candidatus Anaplasma sp. TIGMIC]MDB1135334.1 hypothetical protein [Candidatus Anaplasma sp. TIGMIC]